MHASILKVARVLAKPIARLRRCQEVFSEVEKKFGGMFSANAYGVRRAM